MCNLLDNFIGIRGCSEDVPGSGFYLNDSPGVSLFTASKIADSEDVSGIALMERVLQEAYRKVPYEIVSVLGENGYILREDRIVYGNDATRMENKVLSAGTDWTVKIYPASPYERTTIDRIEVYALAGGTVTWEVTLPGGETETGNKAVTANEVTTVEINKQYTDEATLKISSDVDLQFYNGVSCYCLRGVSTPGRLWIVSNYDICLLAYNYRRMFSRGFLMAATIGFMLEAKVSDRINKGQRFSEESANTVLLELRGGVDPATGFRVTGEYPKFVNAVTGSLINEIRSGRLPGFDCEGVQSHYLIS